MKKNNNVRLGLLVFLCPAVILFLTFFVFPVIYVFLSSFTNWDGISKTDFVGFANYIKIFSDSSFVLSIKNNIIWSIVASFVQVPIALLMAIILSKKPKGWKAFRTIYFFPQIISGVILATLWQAVYNGEYGMLNAFLDMIGLGGYTTNWLGNPSTALASVIAYWVFYIGYYLVIIMSSIANIDSTYYEAAEIDGATVLQQDKHITLPLIKNSIMICMTLAAVLGIRAFEQVYTMTNGGPANRTSVMGLYLYKQMQNGNYGRANATAMILIIVGIIIILGLRTIFNYKENSEKRLLDATSRNK